MPKAKNKSEKRTSKTNPTKILPPRWKKLLLGGGMGLVVFASILLIIFGVFNIIYADRIYPRVKLANQKVGGKTKSQTLSIIEPMVLSAKNQKVILISSDGKSWTAKPEDLGFNPDLELSVDSAFGFARHPNWARSLVEMGSLAFTPQKVELSQAYDQNQLTAFIAKVASEVDTPAQDASLVYKKGEMEVTASKDGRQLNQSKTYRQLRSALSFLEFEPIELGVETVLPKVYEEGLVEAQRLADQVLSADIALVYKNPVRGADEQTFDIQAQKALGWIEYTASQIRVPEGRGVYLDAELKDEKINGFAKTITKQLDRSAIDAKLKIENGKAVVFSTSSDGVRVETEKLAQAIKSALLSGSDATITIPAITLKPDVSEGTVNNLGINELIGEATTSFVKSPENRVHNIKTGASFLNGLLVKSGDTFSTIEALGKIDGSTGYLPELVIKENKTQPEFGGGLCQVSTTLFRAALNAGLPIVERQSHSWRVSYYEPPVGLDATIYLPKPDLKIKNDTPGWILIQSSVDTDTKKITFQFYGTKDGRTAKIIGPKLLYSTPPGETVYVDDPSLPSGELKKLENAHPGGSATATYQVFDKTGKLINEQVFNSKYKAVPAKYLRGTGAPAEPPPPQ